MRRDFALLAPVWSRSNAFGHGVPFLCPSSPDTGPGLTDLGKELIGACNRLGILIDLSHLNERGFWDVAAISNAPLVATHSNAHALSPHARNLTDKQLTAIGETGGMVGVNFATSYLRPDGRQHADTPVDLVIEHLEHILKHVGEDGVGFGSDFDGAKVPTGVGNAAGLQNLVEIMRGRGYGEPAAVEFEGSVRVDRQRLIAEARAMARDILAEAERAAQDIVASAVKIKAEADRALDEARSKAVCIQKRAQAALALAENIAKSRRMIDTFGE